MVPRPHRWESIGCISRNKNEVLVTSRGQAIVEQARRVLDEVGKIPHLARGGQDQLSGVLRLGTIPTIGPYLLPKLIPILRRSAPAMQLLIQENFTHVLGEELKNGQVDVILIALPFEEPGIVTRAVLRLFPKARSRCSALVAVNDFGAVGWAVPALRPA